MANLAGRCQRDARSSQYDKINDPKTPHRIKNAAQLRKPLVSKSRQKEKKIPRLPVLAGKARRLFARLLTIRRHTPMRSALIHHFSASPWPACLGWVALFSGQCDLPCTDTNQLTMEWPFHTASWTQKPRRWAPDRVSVGHACDDISAHASGSQQLALGGQMRKPSPASPAQLMKYRVGAGS